MKDMRRMIIIVFMAVLTEIICGAQRRRASGGSLDGTHELEFIMRLSGCASPEEMEPDEIERLSALLSRPLRINMASERALAASGLLSRYQIASLADYRSRHGDVMSYSELAAVDGFGETFTAALAPFVSLESMVQSGSMGKSGGAVHSDAAIKAGARWPLCELGDADAGMEWSSAVKARVTYGEHLGFLAGVSYGYSAPVPLPTAFTGSLSVDFRRIRSRIVIGDFNARYGQGLALWNGMTMGALESPSSFMKKPTGISQSWSYTGSMAHTGVAAEFVARSFSVSVSAGIPGLKKLTYAQGELALLPAINAAWFCRSGQVSVTHYAEMSGVFSGRLDGIPDMKTSLDAAFCIRGTDVFSEVSFDWLSCVPAVLAGTVFPVCEGFRMAAITRYYPSGYHPAQSGAASSSTKCSNEYAASLSGEFSAGRWVKLRGKQGYGASIRRHVGIFSADAGFFPDGKSKGSVKDWQVQAKMKSEHMLADFLKLSVRLAFRYRTWGEPFRTDCRSDLSFISGRFSSAVRFNALVCSGTGLLGYAEGGYRDSAVSVFLRQGFFRIDNWNDRIYVYERDAPGSFIVPAFYGRGMWTSAVASWKFARWGRFYLRAAFTSYPFMKGEKKKPGRAELKVQFVFRI